MYVPIGLGMASGVLLSVGASFLKSSDEQNLALQLARETTGNELMATATEMEMATVVVPPLHTTLSRSFLSFLMSAPLALLSASSLLTALVGV